MDLRDERELALQRLTGVCHAGFISVTDFRYGGGGAGQVWHLAAVAGE